MSSVKSPSRKFFYPALFKKNITRFWPLWTAFFVYWLFAMPMRMLTSRSSNMYELIDRTVLRMAAQDSQWMAVVFGVVCAMAVLSYLYHHKNSSFIHALPVRREGLFITNYLSGVAFFVVPTLAIFVLTAVAEIAVIGEVRLSVLLQWLVCVLTQCGFYFTLAFFCGLMTGNILALPIFYGIVNCLVYVVYGLVCLLMEYTMFGYSGSATPWFVDWATPVMQIGQNLSYNFSQRWVEGMGYPIAYMLLGTLLLVAGLLIYRRWHLENAGEVVAVPWVRPIFRYGFGIVGGMGLGVVVYATFGFTSMGMGALVALVAIWGGVCYFAAEMLLQKSFRVLKRWKGSLIVVAVLLLTTLTFVCDFVGYENKVPQPQQVVGGTLHISGLSPSDDMDNVNFDLSNPAHRQFANSLHSAIVGYAKAPASYDYDYNTADSKPVVVDSYDGYWGNVQESNRIWVRFEYVLASGGIMERAYDVTVNDALLADEGSPASLIEDYVNQPEVILAEYFDHVADLGQPIYAEIEVEKPEILPTYGEDAPAPEVEAAVIADPAQLEQLMTAMEIDIAEGQLGTRFLLDSQERYETCYYSDIRLVYSTQNWVTQGKWGQDSRETWDVVVTIQTTADDTLGVLEEIGVEGLMTFEVK